MRIGHGVHSKDVKENLRSFGKPRTIQDIQDYGITNEVITGDIHNSIRQQQGCGTNQPWYIAAHHDDLKRTFPLQLNRKYCSDCPVRRVQAESRIRGGGKTTDAAGTEAQQESYPGGEYGDRSEKRSARALRRENIHRNNSAHINLPPTIPAGGTGQSKNPGKKDEQPVLPTILPRTEAGRRTRDEPPKNKRQDVTLARYEFKLVPNHVDPPLYSDYESDNNQPEHHM